MKSCEDAIVTLKFLPGGKCFDMELPSFMPLEELEKKLLETLRVMNPASYDSVMRLRFRQGEREFRDGTLASLGIWDGGILEIMLQGEVQ
jgi:uncharacterized ubiquitin-like protein YukD